MRKTRRGPGLSGLIVALLGAAWLAGQVIGGVFGMVSVLMHASEDLSYAAQGPAAVTVFVSTNGSYW